MEGEPRRTREFITKRHSRIVDEKSLLEFFEQYSPLASKQGKRRGVEAGEDRENMNPNSPTLDSSPRPKKRSSIEGSPSHSLCSAEDKDASSKLKDLFRAGEHTVRDEANLNFSLGTPDGEKPMNPALSKPLRKGKRKSDVDILCAELTASASSPGKKRRTSLLPSQVAGEAMSPLAASRGHRRKVSYNDQENEGDQQQENEGGVQESNRQPECIVSVPSEEASCSNSTTPNAEEKQSKRSFLTRAFSRNKIKATEPPTVPRDAPMVSLVRLLVDKDMPLIDTIVSKAPLEVVDELVQVCVPLFDYVDNSYGLYSWALDKDITSSSASGKDTLFRGESFIVKIIGQHMKNHGIPYLKCILSDILQELSLAQEDLEIDAMKLRIPEEEKPARVQQNCSKLIALAERLANRVLTQTEAIPASFFNIFSLIRTAAKQINPTLRLTVVASFFFLRFVSLALVVPQEFELVKEPLSDKVRRTLTLLGKVLQSLSNQVEFGEKESFMVPLNPFVRNTMPAMKRFLKTISTVKATHRITPVHPVDMLTAAGCKLWEEDAFIEALHGMRRFLLLDRTQFILSRHQTELDEELLCALQHFPAELTESQKLKAQKKKEKQQKAMAKKSASQRKLKLDDKKSSLHPGLDKRRMSSSNIFSGFIGGGKGEEGEGEDSSSLHPLALIGEEDMEGSGGITDPLSVAMRGHHFGTPGRRQMKQLLSTSKKLIQLPRSDSRPFLRAKRKNSINNMSSSLMTTPTSPPTTPTRGAEASPIRQKNNTIIH